MGSLVSMMLWGALLFAQAFSFTLVSRARNSNSLSYHAVASLLSNGVWFASQLILIDNAMGLLRSGSVSDKVRIGLFYAAFTMSGSIVSHWLSMKGEKCWTK